MKAMLFDLDGTLVDTAPDLGHAANHLRTLEGLPPLPLADYQPVASAGARGLIDRALGLTPEADRYPALRDIFLEHYRAHLADHSRLFPGMDALLCTLESAGQPWGVVTNKPSWLTRPLMAALELDSRAAVCVSADEVAAAKPAPDALLRACELLRLAPQDCVYVGDDLRDIQAGRAAGLYTVAAGWGYIGTGGPPESWQADHIAWRVTDLHTHLQKGITQR
jgi:N-acetyl-D-muramate 6-phosphate phosphatase